MDRTIEDSLLSDIKKLSPEQLAEVKVFVEFLVARSRRKAALDRLLTIAPALEVLGVPPLSEEEIAAEIKAVREERRAHQAAASAGADRS